ncbi:MAG TPA: SusC/RagA family TonB-linked outer membrane protein, partial [Puia sp.]|nr:SusC/RagA family TonB-linked outer membrane protein [Puia sp.]
SHGELSYEVLPGLELKTSLGYTDLQTGEYTDAPTAAIDPTLRSFVPSSADFANYDYQTWIVEPQASYKVKLGGGKLSALVGGTIEQNTSQGQVLQATGFTSDQLLGNIQAASSIVVNAVTNTQYKYGAIFGRLGYSWMDKYLLDLTARRDGSSRFGPGKQYANFGAAGGARIFSREEFVQKALPFLSFGKLRASYGTSGNDQIPDYGFMSLYSSTINPFLGSQGIYPYNLANPDYAWEINKKLEGGIELGLFKDRILAGASFYRNRSSSQLVGYPLSTVTGFTSVQANLAAVVQNTGWEFSVTTKNIAGKDFSWTSNINLTIPRNKLLSFPGLASSSYAGSYVIGQPLTIFKAAHSLGADSATGSYVFSDVKGNPTFNPTFPDDYTVLVDLAPKFYGGFENSFRYKGFQLDFLFQFVKQTGAIFISNELPGVEGIQQPVAVLKRWQKPGDKTNIQKFNEDYSLDQAWYDYAENSDGGYGDASYIRLKNLSFSYTLPSSWEHKLHLQNCRVYVQGQNLLTITHYAGMDPENPSVVPSLPPLKVITAGIQLGL